MSRGVLKGLFGLCLAVVVTAVMAAPASARFTLGTCRGAAITGQGASFQAAAQRAWITDYVTGNAYCGPLGETAAGVTYNSTSSGAARRGFLDRDFAGTAFAATDEAPGSTGAAQDTVDGLERGPSGRDRMVLETIPAAQGAIAVLVNEPRDCTADRPISRGVDTRPAIEKSEVEDIFASTITTWRQIRAFAGTADCTGQIERVVRSDDSGTSFQFKSFLDTVDATTRWPTLANTAWPDPSRRTPPTTAARGSGVVTEVARDLGSIGYAVLADARPTFGRTNLTDPSYWLALREGAATGTGADRYEDPATSGIRGATKGANCRNARYTSVPATTQSDDTWPAARGFNSTGGAYPICNLTYILAWDDPELSEDPRRSNRESIQRSVRDYLEYVTDRALGQATLAREDYAALPTAVQALAAAGVDRVCWDVPGTGACGTR